MKKYILYGHDGSANHGCEALVRTTTNLLKDANHSVHLVSKNPQEDTKYGIDKLCDISIRDAKATRPKKDISFLRAYYELKVRHNYMPMDYVLEAQALNAQKQDIAVAIGGDSYCYGDTTTNHLIHQHNVWKHKGMKTVLWGCSIEPELIDDPELREDFSSFDLITVRESISYEALKQINPNTILVADSAFLLDEVRLPLPDGFEGKDIVGINASPLIERRESTPGIVRCNFERLIETILADTTYQILLIPHVVWPNNDDRSILHDFLVKYENSGRVAMVEDHNSMELKGYISRCRFFIGARTHASIAAYSTGVPTVVLGYSTKAKGIAKDLFGTYHNYVISAQDLRRAEELSERWKWLKENEKQCKEKLQDIIPAYIQRVYSGQKVIKEL